jgi:8-oxo-dGTP pyrophosphatase MutT (NUDIX family)
MPGYWHCVPAGQVDSADFASVLRKELMEELGIDWSTVRQASLLALMDTGVEQGQKYELTFHIQLSCTAAEVYKLYCSAEDSHEHANLVFVTGPSFVGSTAVDADVSAEAAFPMVDFETFMRGDYMLTDISRRGLSLHREMRSAS